MKSLVGLILSIVGAIFNLFLSGVFLLLFIGAYFGRTFLIENNLSETLIDFSAKLNFWFIFLCIWFLIVGIVGIVSSSFMNREQKVAKGGLISLISGIVSLNLFLIVGGIMAILTSKVNEGGNMVNNNVVQNKLSPNDVITPEI